jgi:hypothetical protein
LAKVHKIILINLRVARGQRVSPMNQLFSGVKFYIPETLSQERSSQLTHAIESNGGERADTIQSATHIITNSHRFQGWQDAEDVTTVSVRPTIYFHC